MSLRDVVNQIFRDNTNYLSAQQALNQARSLKSLSNDLYTDPLRFVYELVQNCDDACQPQSILRIAIVDHRYLVVGHNGKPFNIEDLRGLCDVGCSTKGRDEQTTGYKGLGFKAVFGKSDHILVVSNGEYFRFEANSKVFQWNTKWGANQTIWEQTNNRKFEFPWQICPIWTEKNDVPESIQKWLLGQLNTVATIIYLKNVRETQTAVEQLIEHPHVFMFLRNIRIVRFSFNSPQETILNISGLRDGSVKVIYDWRFISHWLLCSCDVPVPDNARNDSRLPEKLQDAKKTEIILAAKIDSNDNIESVQGRHNALFAYLPTKITTYNLPILVNANFLTNASREHIHTDSAWNQFLFSCIPHEMVKWIGRLMRQPKWSNKALDLLPNPINIRDNLAEKYNENCPKAVIDVPFLLNTLKQPLKISEAVIDITDFSRSQCIGDALIRDFILRTYSPTPRIALHPFISNSSRLRKFKILLFDWDKCLEMLNDNEFLEKFTPEQNIQYITYLFNNQTLPQIHTRLRILPFLMDRTGILRTINSIYIPSHVSNVEWPESNETDTYLHDSIMQWLRTQSAILEWLKALGLLEMTEETFVRQYIIPHIRTYIKTENAVSTVKKLFASFQRGRLSNDLLKQLNKLKLFSVEQTLVPADELYFSDSYLPRLSLSNFNLDDGNFLSPIYVNGMNSVINQWKQFFLSLGVQEDIKLIRFNEDQRNEIVSAYRFKQTENLFRYGLLKFQHCLTLPFLEVAQSNYNFALDFWRHVINSININQLNEKETLVSGQQQLFKVDNLPYWFVRARSCIPTTTNQLLKSTEVFSSDLRSIASDLLPIFACTTHTPFPIGWQHFFQFKIELSIQDHLQLLTLMYDRSKSSPLNDENETYIQRIYTSLINCLSKFDRNYLEQHRPGAPFYLISTINNDFVLSTDLVMPLNRDLTLPNQIHQLKLSTGNSRDVHLPRLLDFFNIRQIGINDLTLSTNLITQPSRFLRAKIRDIQPRLFELAHSQNIIDHRIDHDLEFFEADRLELNYNNTIPILQVPIHVIDHRIYVTRPWNSNEVMLKLPQILCKQFKLPPNFEADTRRLLLVEQITPSMTILPPNPTIDLLGLGGTRGKFAMVIDRDNEQLFSHLGITDTTSPAELLFTGLEAQESPWAGYVYHYTHLENAVSILRDGALRCRSSLASGDFKDSAASDVVQKTRDEVKNYARFYFRPLTPTQYCNENLGLPNLSNRYGNQPMCPVPIFFRINLAAILAMENIKWKVSLGNMASPHTEFDNTIIVVKKFDFQNVYADLCTERGKYSSQQEFLIESQLNLDQLKDEDITIVFQDENARYSLGRMITHNYPSNIDSSYYYGSHSRIIIRTTDIDNEMMVYLDLKESSDYGKLILQLSGANTNRTIEGNLISSFQRGDVSTVYANQQLSFIANLNNIQFAVYYEYKNQVWLIHTNSPTPRFDPPTH